MYASRMDSTQTPTADDIAADLVDTDSSTAPAPAPADELLIEEISIDGMCGVY